jgi:hypothetical protein
MRIIAATRQGIEALVDEALAKVPINRILEWAILAHRHLIGMPLKGGVAILPLLASFGQEYYNATRAEVYRNDGKRVRRVDIVGPYQTLPAFVVARDAEDMQHILEKGREQYGYKQNELIVHSDSIFLREVEVSPYSCAEASYKRMVWGYGLDKFKRARESKPFLAFQDLAYEILQLECLSEDFHPEAIKVVVQDEFLAKRLVSTLGKQGLKRL